MDPRFKSGGGKGRNYHFLKIKFSVKQTTEPHKGKENTQTRRKKPEKYYEADCSIFFKKKLIKEKKLKRRI